MKMKMNFLDLTLCCYNGVGKQGIPKYEKILFKSFLTAFNPIAPFVRKMAKKILLRLQWNCYL